MYSLHRIVSTLRSRHLPPASTASAAAEVVGAARRIAAQLCASSSIKCSSCACRVPLSLSFPLPVRPFVRPSARPSRPSVRPSVRPFACLLHGPPASLAADRWVGGSVGRSVGLSLSGWGLACSKRRCSFFRFRFAHLELPRCRCRCRPSNSVCVHGRMRAHTNAYARMQS